MTHEYLVEAVNSPTYRNSRSYEHPYLVIAAILELHKPVDNTYFAIKKLKACEECVTAYPCSTIEVLKAELNA